MRRLVLATWLALAGWRPLESPDPAVEAGNRAYARGDYARALAHYGEAELDVAPMRIEFDRGAALYKLGAAASGPERDKLLEQAEQAFRRAAETPDGVLRSAAYYNLGNTLVQRGREAEAASAYRRALRANPQNGDARHNLELVLRNLGRAPKPPAPAPAASGPKAGSDPESGPRPESGPDPEAGATPAPEPPPPPPPSFAPTPPKEPRGDADRDGRTSESERKLERLERRSHELRRRLLRGDRRGGEDRGRSAKDW